MSTGTAARLASTTIFQPAIRLVSPTRPPVSCTRPVDFRSRLLDQVINMDHALVKLARTIDWGFLE
jgi:hypothetical protein